MKKLLAISTLFGVLALVTPFCAAREQLVLSQEQEKDISELVQKMQAQLPVGWSVEYPAIPIDIWPRKSKLPSVEAPYFDRIKIKRAGMLEMRRPTVPNAPRNNGSPPYYEEFEIRFKIEPFLTPVEYDKVVANNEQIRQQLLEIQRVLRAMRVSHKFYYYFPKTAEEKEKVDAYNDLKKQLVSLPKFYFGKLGLSYENWGLDLEERKYNRVQDRVVRRECAVVTQKIDSLLTRYAGDKLEIDERSLSEK